MTDDGKDIITYYGGSDNNIANVSVYDASGRCVRKLVDEARVPGFYQVVWDGRDDLGQKVPSGSYFCRLSTKNLDGSATTITKKMILLK
ncbi:T9SS type A sorting domain-containing protein [candidate division TA06 bacterium]|uniref:T9SS type A sorting domain-containing protein n=1 Tax=candidate division TA06 bacterium TaxID=2250710 RepID=A0A523XVI0_UNCT6|nr:MAG: T9SS type A sorting domain-containing protein [candidate division TA06 bacterium]